MTSIFRLSAFLRPFTFRILLSVLASALTIGSSIGLLGTSAYLISMAALQPSIAVLQVAIVGVRFFGITRGIFRYLERLISHSVNLQILSRLRTWFFKSIEPLVPAGLIHIQQGDLFSRSMADIEALEHFFIRVVSPPLTAVLVIAGSAMYLSHFSSTLSLILVIGAVVSGIILPLLVYLINVKANQNIPELQSKLTVDLLDYLQGQGDLLMAGRETDYRKAIKQHNAALVNDQLSLNLTGSALSSLNLLTVNLTMLAVLVEGVRLVTAGTVNGVMLGAFTLITLAAFESTQPLITSALFLDKTSKAADRLFGLTAQTQPVVEPAHHTGLPDSFDLTVNDLTFHYSDSTTPVFDDLNLHVRHGSHVAVVGKSGSGKTTLANLLLRFWEFNQGKILIGGSDIRSLTGEQVREIITVVDQSGYIFEASVRENLTLGVSDVSDTVCLDMLSRMNLSTWFDSLPSGLDTHLGERGITVSAGERQRINMARALLRRTPIYILDEPTANLDAETSNHILKIALDLTHGSTVIWITHSLTNLDQLDQIFMLDNGMVIEAGTHSELSRSASRYARLLSIQQGTVFN